MIVVCVCVAERIMLRKELELKLCFVILLNKGKRKQCSIQTASYQQQMNDAERRRKSLQWLKKEEGGQDKLRRKKQVKLSGPLSEGMGGRGDPDA